MVSQKSVPFIKMHGLGNDFVIVEDVELTPEQIRQMSDRKRGIGCDQLIVLKLSKTADSNMAIYNADGSEAGACGNASRCVADIILNRSGKAGVSLETPGGLIHCERADAQNITVDMGEARLDWREIPLARREDTLHLNLSVGHFADPVAVNVGNPHAVFFVENVESQPIEIYGPQLENDPLFPEKANIEFAEIIAPDTIRMRVWERGAGITQACGTGACACAVAAIRRGLTGRRVKVIMDGGELQIEWRDSDNHVLMTGGFTYSFAGSYNLN